MSLILDALKKLDREKSSRRSGAAHIPARVLRRESSRPKKKKLFYLATVSFTAVAAAAITYAVSVGWGPLSKLSLFDSLKAPERGRQVAPESDRPVEPVAHSPEPIGEDRKEQNETALKTQIPVERKDAAEEKISIDRKIPGQKKNPPESKLSAGSKPAESKDAQAKKPETTPKGPPRTSPLLNLSGIIWSEERSKRHAIINDIIAPEGAEIEGVKIVEIRRSHVRLSYTGQVFEMALYQ